MRFALLGDHRDGLDLGCALTASGRHELRLYAGPAAGLTFLQRQGVRPRSIGDLEELLADPDLDAVIVASSPTVRAAQLRRALQSECHVVCVHPADPSPDIAYEAAMIQADTGRVLLPMLPAALHPGIVRLAELARAVRRAFWNWKSGQPRKCFSTAPTRGTSRVCRAGTSCVLSAARSARSTCNPPTRTCCQASRCCCRGGF